MTPYLAFFLGFFGTTELWILLVVALLLFGHRVPSMARSLGSGITEFKKGLKGDSDATAQHPQVGDGSGTTGNKGGG